MCFLALGRCRVTAIVTAMVNCAPSSSPSPLPPRSAEHSSLFEPSPTGDPWNAWCLGCNTDVGTRRQDMKGWHISKGAIAAKSSRNLALWSCLQLTREWFQSEDSDSAESDKTQFYSNPLPSPSPPAPRLLRPPPHHRQHRRQQLRKVLLKDVGGGKTFLLLRAVLWLGSTKRVASFARLLSR